MYVYLPTYFFHIDRTEHSLSQKYLEQNEKDDWFSI